MVVNPWGTQGRQWWGRQCSSMVVNGRQPLIRAGSSMGSLAMVVNGRQCSSMVVNAKILVPLTTSPFEQGLGQSVWAPLGRNFNPVFLQQYMLASA